MNAREVDILLILEGTYPYVRGGVSKWVEQLIQGSPEYTFGIIFLGSKKEDYPHQHYELAKNVIYFESVYLFSQDELVSSKCPKKKGKKNNERLYNNICLVHDNLKQMQSAKCLAFNDIFGHCKTDGNNIFDEYTFDQSYVAWEYITEKYSELSKEPSFIDYFWTVRNIHEPLWSLDQVASNAPKHKVIHSPCTGYAGFLATLISQYQDSPLIVTEHGIYTRERYLELVASPLAEPASTLEKFSKDIDYLNTMWINFFDSLARISYSQANYITSLYNGARKIQISSGADPKKTLVIPNGIRIDNFKHLAENKTLKSKPKKIVGLVGRLVRIKSTLDFIRAIGRTRRTMPDIEGWICYIGDPEEGYMDEVTSLIEVLKLNDTIKFVKSKHAADLFVDIDLLCISSVSEGMPLNLLEAFAAGLPAVCTNVGACAEMIVGKNEKDRALGAAGIIVSLGDISALSNAIETLLSSEDNYQKTRKVAQQRVENLYSEKDMLEGYKKLYKEYIK